MKTALLVSLALLVVVGCSQNNSASLPYAGRPPMGIVDWSEKPEGPSTPGVDEVKVLYFGDSVIVWSDFPTSNSAASIAYASKEDHVGGGGQLINNEYGFVEFRCLFDTETTGTATIADQTYDISKGGLFLVSIRGEQPKVEQVDCDLSGVKMTEQGLKPLIDSEPAIKKFFAAAQPD